MVYTDLLCPQGILKQNEQTRWLMATRPEDRPMGMQLYGNDPAIMAEAARWAVDHGADLVDINMGCPVDKVTKTFAGSMMLCTPDATVGVAEAILDAVGGRVPVTAKTRLGYDADTLTAPALARRLVRAGVACLTIHGRTAAQRFKGHANHDGIRAVVEAVHDAAGGRVPCIGNGDIRTPFDARAMVDATGCDGVMIARAALGAPWLLRDTANYLATGEIPGELTLRERLGCVLKHAELFDQLREDRDQRYTLNRIKQKFSGYAKHMGHIKPLKLEIMAMTELAELRPAIERFLDEAGDAADAVPVSWAERDAMLRATSTVAA